MDIMKYFRRSASDKLDDGRAQNIPIQDSISFSLISAARELNSFQEQREQKKKRQVLPENVKKEIGFYAWKYGNLQRRRWIPKNCLQFSFKRETVRDWKLKYQKTSKTSLNGE